MSRARQALKAPLPVRLARTAVPGVAALALCASGVVAYAQNDQALTAEPASVASVAAARPLPVPSQANENRISRSADRTAGTAKSNTKASTKTKAAKKSAAKALGDLKVPERSAVAGSRYTTEAVNVRSAPSAGADPLTVVDAGTRLTITRTSQDGWQQVVHAKRTGWVKASYLTSKKPAAASKKTSSASTSTAAGVSGGGCSSGNKVESGLTSNAIRVHRAICNAFPQISSYGGRRADSVPAHPSGRALDAMIPNYSSSAGNDLGWQVAKYVRAHALELGVTEVIFDQHIWTTQRGGEGWRSMSSRGGATANHRDHVHVTVR